MNALEAVAAQRNATRYIEAAALDLLLACMAVQRNDPGAKELVNAAINKALPK